MHSSHQLMRSPIISPLDLNHRLLNLSCTSSKTPFLLTSILHSIDSVPASRPVIRCMKDTVRHLSSAVIPSYPALPLLNHAFCLHEWLQSSQRTTHPQPTSPNPAIARLVTDFMRHGPWQPASNHPIYPRTLGPSNPPPIANRLEERSSCKKETIT